MPTRSSSAVWKGNLKDGSGSMTTGSGVFDVAFSAASRFEDGDASNPEELIGAAHAGCFSMAFSNELAKAGHEPNSVETDAEVTLDMVDGTPTITTILLNTRGDVPGIDEETFLDIANGAKKNCPVSRALAGVDIKLNAKLI